MILGLILTACQSVKNYFKLKFRELRLRYVHIYNSCEVFSEDFFFFLHKVQLGTNDYSYILNYTSNKLCYKYE